mmetsp:Transcript_28486/g.57883  ORF Transcript_28486/g.57883 Transcript_28486/m.57883 type:complete len:108 (-) Transcript_28486:110-433(-)
MLHERRWMLANRTVLRLFPALQRRVAAKLWVSTHPTRHELTFTLPRDQHPLCSEEQPPSTHDQPAPPLPLPSALPAQPPAPAAPMVPVVGHHGGPPAVYYGMHFPAA